MTEQTDLPTDTEPDSPDLDALAQAAAQKYESLFQFLDKWENGLSRQEANKVLAHNREHPIVRAFVTKLREWREEAMEMVVEENQSDAVLRERLGEVRALQRIEEGILNIQLNEGVDQ